MYARFGQELYAKETIAAAEIVALHHEDDSLAPLTARIADALPQRSPATRQRVANKLLQRMAAGAAGCASYEAARSFAIPTNTNSENHSNSHAAPSALPDNLTAFACLLFGLPDSQARRELVYYAVARADRLVEAIACDILYPYFIEDRIPTPYSEDEFIMANAGLLLAPEPTLTAGFVTDYARRVWKFDCSRTLCLALRILRQAGVLFSAPLLGERGRVHAYTLAPHGLSLAALLWGLHAEFGRESIAPGWDQVSRAGFARLFVVPPSVVASRLWEAEKAGLVGFWSAGGIRRVAVKVRDPGALSSLLLSGPEPK